MTTAILAAKRGLRDLQQAAASFLSWRVLVPAALVLLSIVQPSAGRIVVDTIAEAYLQVSAFVAATLALIYGVERVFHFNLADSLRARPRAQVPVAAFLGALPGCGGAIIVVTQYVNGHVGFGALIAVLTATMGDAAFLLLSQEPQTAAMVLGAGFVIGTLSGLLVDLIHGRDFLSRNALEPAAPGDCHSPATSRRRLSRGFDGVWLALMVPGVIFAVPIAAQLDPNTWFGPLAVYEPVTLLGFAGGVLAVAMWVGYFTTEPGANAPSVGNTTVIANPNDTVGLRPSMRSRVVNDTNFVTVWVIAAFLLFELGIHFTGADLASWFEGWMVLTPLVALLVGFLPGCGPQIIITTLYLTGVIPMGALLANAISNDGDALFPAIALAPKAAIIATLYTGVPALIVGYGVYFAMH